MKKTVSYAWLYIVAICIFMFAGHVKPINSEEEPDALHVVADALVNAARKEIRALSMPHAMRKAADKEAEKVAYETVLVMSRDAEFSAAFDAAKNTDKFTSLKNEAFDTAIKAARKAANEVMLARIREAALDAAIKAAEKVNLEVNDEVILVAVEKAAREALIDIDYRESADFVEGSSHGRARKGIREAVETIRIERIAELLKTE